MPAEQQTILIAGGLERRAGRRELEGVLSPTARGLPRLRRRARRGERRPAPSSSTAAERAHPRGAPRRRPDRVRDSRRDVGARRRLHAPRCLRGRGHRIGRRRRRRSSRRPSRRRDRCRQVAAALARRTAVTGVSILLDHPRLTGRYRGYPSSPAVVDRPRALPLRRLVNMLPGRSASTSCRAGRELDAVAVLAGPPPSRTPRRCCGASRCAASSSTARSTRSSCRCRGDRCTSRGSRSTRSPPPRSASAMPFGSGATSRRSAKAGRSSCCTISAARSGTARRRRTATSSTCSARAATEDGLAAARDARPPTARDRRLPPGPRAASAAPVPRLGVVRAGSRARRAACSSRAAATPARRGRSGSSRATASATALEMARGVAGGSHRRRRAARAAVRAAASSELDGVAGREP